MSEQRTMVILVSCTPMTTEGLCVHMEYLIHLYIDSSTADAVITSKYKLPRRTQLLWLPRLRSAASVRVPLLCYIRVAVNPAGPIKKTFHHV